jgi:hypothetical protein
MPPSHVHVRLQCVRTAPRDGAQELHVDLPRPGIRLVAGGVVQGCVGARGELGAGRQAAVPVRLLRLQPGYI